MGHEFCRPEYLDAILQDRCEQETFAAAVDHLSNCRMCCRRLEQRAADAAVWNSVREHLSAPEIEVPDSLPPVSTLITGTLQTAEALSAQDIRAFLSPPRHPEFAGRIGSYDIEREIGRGGMGIVLKGFDSELNRPVAVKLLAPHLASSATARRRFIREARAAAAVVHENVVAIHGIQTDGPLPAIVMPFISGRSLQQQIDQHGPLDAVDVVRIGIQIASGLAAAHDQGLVHRDIKPANIMLEHGLSRVQIMDFGLARAADDAEITRSGMITGTPAFMSPEQALGDSIDHRSDQFSLGSVLYFAVSGCLPFHASTPMGVLQQICHGRPRRLRDIDPQIPAPVKAVIEKLMARSPDDRFPDAAAVRDWLTACLAHLQNPDTAEPPPKLRRHRSAAPAFRLVAALTAVLAAISLTVGIAAWNIRTKTDSVSASSVNAAADGPTTRIPDSLVSAAVIDEEIRSVRSDLERLEQAVQPVLSAGITAEIDDLPRLTLEVLALEQKYAEDGTDPISEITDTDTWTSALQRLEKQLDSLESGPASGPVFRQ